MKRFFDKKDLTALWEEDGDLRRMQEFFSTIDGDTEDKESIKLSIKQKALEKLAKTEGFDELPVHQPRYEKKGFKQWTSLGWWKSPGQWKLALPIAALALLIIIGQGALSSSWSLFPRMGSSEKSTQSADMAMPAAPPSGSTGAGVEFNVRSKSFSDSAGIKGAEQQPQTQYGMDNTSIMENKAVLPVPPDQGNVPPTDQKMPRKVTHNLDLTLEVASINESVDKISKEVQNLGGYVVTSQQSDSDHYSSASLTVKIPDDKLNGLQNSVSAWGKVLDQRLQANDITNEYYDSQARLQVLEAEEKRYLEILEQAKSVDDVLRVEDSLSNVRQQIEQLKGQLKLWDHQVDYSTVTFQIVTQRTPNLNVKDPWQPVSWNETWQAAKDAVLKTLSSTWNGLNYLVVGFGYAIPYLLIGGIAWGVYRFWKKRNL